MQAISPPMTSGPDASVAGPAAASPPEEASNRAFETRLRVLLEVSYRCRAPLSLDQIVAHLPVGGSGSTESVFAWLENHPEQGHVVAGYVMPPGEISVPELVERTARSKALFEEAEWAVSSPLRSAVALARCVGVSGSVAYGYAAPNDDLDFFVTARAGTTWLFLALAFLHHRKVARSHPLTGPSHWCFNFVLDEREAPQEFARPGGLLFAREALSVRILRGDAYYRGLLVRAPWMSGELPQLYAQRIRPVDTAPTTAGPTPWLARAANLVVF